MSSILPFLPHTLAKRVERYRELRRLGLSAGDAASAVISASAWSSFLEARLDLLPDGFKQKAKCIVDVGANRGDWSSSVLQFLRPQRLIALEPNPPVFDGLVKRLQSESAAKVLNVAASSQPGELPFHITGGSQCASLLKPAGGMVDLYGGDFAEEKTITVRVDTLDRLLAECPLISLLKIDVQGYEREALAGAHEVLKKTQLVLIEANYVSHYDNDIQFPELHALMNAHGFSLAGLSRPFVKQGRALWADALYRNFSLLPF